VAIVVEAKGVRALGLRVGIVGNQTVVLER